MDLGASSGRAVAGRVTGGRLLTWEVARFPNRPLSLPDGMHWDVPGFLGQILDGLRAAEQGAGCPPVSVGIDSWGVDYGLIDGDGALVGLPHTYRDAQTAAISTSGALDPAATYRITGVPNRPITTSAQLLAARETAALDRAETLLLVPDLLGYMLTGAAGAEVTNASTTQLLDVGRQDWAWSVVDGLGLPRRLLPPLRRPGDLVGEMLPGLAEAAGLEGPVPVRAVASHDTASAVLAVPAEDESFAYLSCGTWALVGVELDHPVLTEDARLAGFTNEAGAGGTVRFLRPVTGLWLLQEALRCWDGQGRPLDLGWLLVGAGRVEGLRSVIDPDDPALSSPSAPSAPPDMVSRIQERCSVRGQPVPEEPTAVARCILDSLALAFAAAFDQAEELSGHEIRVVHLVGGGAANQLLCQLTADACRRPVVAGPMEASVAGNLAVQALADGRLATVGSARALVREWAVLSAYAPTGDATTWLRARSRGVS